MFPRERVVDRAALPVALLLVGYPLWWALGVQFPAWPVLAAPVAVWLYRNRRGLALPPGYGVLVLFLGWVLVSALMLTTVRYAAAYTLRLLLYLAVAVFALFVWNALRRGLEPWRVTGWLTVLWASAVLLAVPGVLVANFEFTSPLQALLSRVGASDPFVVALTHPEFSEWDRLYGVPRPSPLFAYTNDWGAAVGILTPVAVHSWLTAPSRRSRLVIGALLALSLVPVLVSLNRGCWISIGVAVAYVLLRRAAVGRWHVLVGVAGCGLVAAALYTFVPEVNRVVTARFTHTNTSTRETLYDAALGLAVRSPFFGYGAPQSSQGLADSNDVSIGTHGQLWTILVSQGFVGAALFVAAMLTIWWHARPASGRSHDVWLHATGLVLLVQIAFYEVLPVPLAVALFSLAVSGFHRTRDPHALALTRKEDAHERPAP
ncbi:hypothetical protein GCM10028867_19600 [Nocardioides pacificus]